MRLLTRLLLLVCSLSLVSLLFLSRCGLNVDPEVQLEPGTGKYAHIFVYSGDTPHQMLISWRFLATSAEPTATLSPVVVFQTVAIVSISL